MVFEKIWNTMFPAKDRHFIKSAVSRLLTLLTALRSFQIVQNRDWQKQTLLSMQRITLGLPGRAHSVIWFVALPMFGNSQ